MTEVSVLEAKWMQDGAGDWLCLRVPTALSAMDVVDELQPGKEYRAVLRRKGRSLDANAYCWVLMDKLAAHYGATKEGIYQEEIRQIAGVSDIVCVKEKAADELMRRWSGRGLGWMAEKAPKRPWRSSTGRRRTSGGSSGKAICKDLIGRNGDEAPRRYYENQRCRN